MASWLIVAALLQGALALSSNSALTKQQTGQLEGAALVDGSIHIQQKKSSRNLVECSAPCADYDTNNGVNQDTEEVCFRGDGFCTAYSSNCGSASIIPCKQKAPAGGRCPAKCSAWTGTATMDTRNVCQTEVSPSGGKFKIGNHYSCSHVPSGGCATQTDECWQRKIDTCGSECTNRQTSGAMYEYPTTGDSAYKGSDPSDIYENTTLVCQNEYPQDGYADWSGYCLKPPCDYQVHNSLGWNGSQPCRQYFNYCKNSCAGGSYDPDAPVYNDAGELDYVQEYETVGDTQVAIVCFEEYHNKCAHPTNAAGMAGCPPGMHRCGYRKQHQNLDGLPLTDHGWGLAEVTASQTPAAHPHPLMRKTA